MIDAKGSVAIPFSFRPIEAKRYSVDIPIHVEGGNSHTVAFDGLGVMGHASTIGDDVDAQTNTHQLAIPPVQSIPLPNQRVFLSIERLVLGNVPLFAKIHRLIVVSNQSDKEAISFKWCMDEHMVADVVRVRPACGILQPGEDCMCAVTFCSSSAPAIHDHDIRCEIESITERRMYEQICAHVSQERSEAENLLEITHTAPAKSLTVMVGGANGFDDRNSTKVLPPIVSEPKPPARSSVHLGILARTFRAKNASEVTSRNCFLNSEALEERVEIKTGGGAYSSNSKKQIKSSESDVLEDVFLNLLSDILGEDAFQKQIMEIPNEKTPYFAQFNPNLDKDERPESESSTSEKICLLEDIMVDTLRNILSELWEN